MGTVGEYGFHQPEPQRAQHPLTVPVVFGPARRAQFTYRVITTGRGPAARLDEDRLNALGRDGWLLVSVLPRSDGEGGSNLDYLFVRSEP
jgi:hypothetical protein